MDEFLEKSFEKIVGINNYSLLEVSLETQANHFKMNLYKLSPLSINSFINEFNKKTFEGKLDEAYDFFEISRGSKHPYNIILKSYINGYFNESQLKENWGRKREEYHNLKEYEGEYIPYIKWIGSYSNQVLDKHILEFIPSIISKLETSNDDSVRYIPQSFKGYVLYIGDHYKYKGCIGEIMETRNSETSPNLVMFQGIPYKENGIGKMWCSTESLEFL